MHTIFFQISDRIESIHITEMPNLVQPMAYVEFENGYENIFFIDMETGNWVEQDLGFTQLAEVLGPQLKYVLHDHSCLKKTFKWCKKALNHQVFNFGYCTYQSDKEKVYELFAPNRRYMFTIVKKGRDRWQILLMPGTKNWAYNKKFLEVVPYLIENGII